MTTRDDAASLLAEAVAAHRAGNHADAERGYAAILGLDPHHFDALQLLGALAVEGGRMGEGIAFIRRALEIRPAHATAQRNLSRALLASGQAAEALVSAEAACALAATNPANHHARANALASLGRHDESIAAQAEAIRLDPRHGDAWYNLALALLQSARHEEALYCLDRAVALGGDARRRAECETNRAVALRGLGRGEDAIAAATHAVALRPADALAQRNLSVLLEDAGRHAECLAACDAALAAEPAHAATLRRRGAALVQLGRNAEALASLEDAIGLDPSIAEAHDNRGILLRKLGRLAEAEASHRRAISLGPACAEAWNGLGTTLGALGRHAEAIQSYDEAIRLKPGYADAFSNRGSTLSAMGRMDEALASFDRAIALRHDHASAWYNRGNTLAEMNRFVDAIASYDRALSASPSHANALNNRGKALLDMRRVDEALEAFALSSRAAPADWDKRGNALLAMNCSVSMSPEEIAGRHRDFGRAMAGARPPPRPHANAADPRRRLRVGYVSGDFRTHSVGYFLEGVLAAHAARGTIDVVAYANQDGSDAATARMRRHVQGWRDIAGMRDEQAFATIVADRVDILVDLSGHTARSRLPLFAMRPAPVQASWIGYPQTTGLAEMDWIIADPTVLPPEDEHLYVERPMRLEGCYLCYAAPPMPASPLPALARGHVTFGCFNVLRKISDPVLAAWAAILGRLPDARILVKAHALGDPGVAAEFRSAFASLGGDATRLDLEGRLPLDAHRRRFSAVDIMLDPFPYNGCTSTAEALAAGVPVVSMRGRGGMMTRSGETLLKAAGLADWVAGDAAGYAQVAVARARDLGALAALRARIGVAGFSDQEAFTRHLEDAYRRMWAEWCARGQGKPGPVGPGGGNATR